MEHFLARLYFRSCCKRPADLELTHRPQQKVFFEVQFELKKEPHVNRDSSFTSTTGFPATGARLDSELIRRAQQGDAEAFGALFQAHKTRVYSLCLRMTSNVAEAEDLAQDAFLQVFRKLSTFKGNSALSTWIYRIALNTVLMRFRKKTPPQISLDEPWSNNAETKFAPREYGSRDLGLAGCVDRIALTQAIGELPEGYRTIFLLHEVEGYEHGEIAEFLGCSTGNSKSQLHKAKIRIRELLANPQTARSRSMQSKQAKRETVPVIENWEMLLDMGSKATHAPAAAA
jgi:RNA polymerase sigma-70 factor (ECF subfamily)